VAYAPLSGATNSPGLGGDVWIMALILTGFSAIFTGVNLIATIFYLRAPGMTMFRMPIFTWNMLVTAILILIAFPVLTAALIMLWCDRHFGTHIYTVAGGGSPLLWQNLFWFFGHPEVYILALPYFGIVTEVLPVFSKKPVFGYKGMVFATLSIAALSTGVWAHHMFTTGAVLLPFFSLLSLLIAVPTGIKFFNWIGTMWRGQLRFTTPMLFCIGFLFAFLMGLRHRGLRRVRRALLLVSEVLRTDARRPAGQGALLDHVRRLLADLHAPVRGRAEGNATTGGSVPEQPRLGDLQPDLDGRRLRDRGVVRHPAVEPVEVVAKARPGR
jgi:hypothetical protein